MKYQEVYRGLNKKASNDQIKKLASIVGMVKRATDEKADKAVTVKKAVDPERLKKWKERPERAIFDLSKNTRKPSYSQQIYS